MKKFNKVFTKIFIITIVIYETVLLFNAAVLSIPLNTTDIFIGLGGLILFCTELIIEEIKKNKN